MTDPARRLLLWYGVVSALALALFAWDKLMAKLGRRRIPEAALLGAAAAGGGAGALLAMSLLRHKTRKSPFPLLVPLSLLLQAALLLWACLPH